MKFVTNFAIIGIIMCLTTPTIVFSKPFLKKGFINNDDGRECWYKQIEKKNSRYFYGKKLTANTRILTFDKPDCMSNAEFGDFVNIHQINNIISKLYSHNDAAWMSEKEQLRSGSLWQKQGQCIQSRQYPNIGIVVFYHVKKNSIVAVSHAMAISGCNEK